MRLFMLCAAALALGACASGPRETANYGETYERLAMDCQDRGGMLIDLYRDTGYAAADYACRFQNTPARQQ